MQGILVASLIHEVNSFVDSVISLDQIRRYGSLIVGEAMLEATALHGRQLHAALDVAGRSGMTLIPTIHASAGSGGPVSDDAYAFLRDQIVETARSRAGDIVGVYLSLHGAMAAESVEDVEGDLLERVRSVVGSKTPIVASLDLHAYVTERMIRAADALVAYRTYPHTDFYQTGERSMAILLDAIRGRTRPVTRQRKLRMMTSAERQDTNRDPMLGVMQLSRKLEERPGILSASVLPMQPWLDAADIGWSAVVVADRDAGLAQKAADELAWVMWQRREDFRVVKTRVEDAVREAMGAHERPVILVDAADGTMGGAHGDSNVLLRELLRKGYSGNALLTITDPVAAERATAAGEGATVTVPLGGALSPQWYEPLEATAQVEVLRDGRFMLEHVARPYNIGPTAVLRMGGAHVVVSTSQAYPLDESVFHMAGLETRTADIVQVKSALGYRAVYDSFAGRIIEIDTPGPCDSDLTRLPFRRFTRPMWPWDPDLMEPWAGTSEPPARADGKKARRNVDSGGQARGHGTF